jgi:uncharacterized pyridoxal phosphate-containing UPF0001 family protein
LIVLLQVNLAGEEQKGGFEQYEEIASTLVEAGNVQIFGLWA